MIPSERYSGGAVDEMLATKWPRSRRPFALEINSSAYRFRLGFWWEPVWRVAV